MDSTAAGPGGFAYPAGSGCSPAAPAPGPLPARLSALAADRVLVIVRHPRPFDPAPLVRASLAAGIRTLEISLNTPEAFGILERAAAAGGDALTLGAGTVMTPGEAAACVRAGARFLVSPSLAPDVAAWCRAHGVPYMPGALTPSEIAAAHAGGAACVKVFPAAVFGPSYIASVRAPFPAVRLLAVGGVSAANARSWIDAGAFAVAVGASTVRPEAIERGDEDALRCSLEAVARAALAAQPPSTHLE